MILYFFSVLRIFHLFKVNILRKLNNNIEDNLEIIQGAGIKAKGVELVTNLQELFAANKGDVPVYVNFMDLDDELTITLMSRIGVNYTVEFRNRLKELGVDFKESLNIKV